MGVGEYKVFKAYFKMICVDIHSIRTLLQYLGNCFILFNVTFYPLSNFPQGGKVLFLPPWGKARMGV
jgi:hypothetical protein